jgi:hypothetical protein
VLFSPPLRQTSFTVDRSCFVSLPLAPGSRLLARNPQLAQNCSGLQFFQGHCFRFACFAAFCCSPVQSFKKLRHHSRGGIPSRQPPNDQAFASFTARQQVVFPFFLSVGSLFCHLSCVSLLCGLSPSLLVLYPCISCTRRSGNTDSMTSVRGYIYNVLPGVANFPGLTGSQWHPVDFTCPSQGCGCWRRFATPCG